MNCKYCKSENVIKFGTYKETQYYYCKECKRKFSNIDAIPKMQYSTSKIADSLNMYYEGMSLKEIRRNLIQQHGDYISDSTIFNWVKRFSKQAIMEAGNYKPKVGKVWVADETMIELDGKNVWLWDIIDTKTRFLIATHMSFSRTTKDAQSLMEQAYKRTGVLPRIIYTDKLRAYLEGIELTFGANTEHKAGSPFDIGANNNYIERFHSTIKSRTKVMRGLKTMETARLFLDGWLIHYNFFRPHMSLKDKTPAMEAECKFPFRNWKDITEQPYEKTARIPVTFKAPRKPVKRTLSKGKRKVETSMPKLSGIRLK